MCAAPAAADLEFFEKKIRPLLVERCYECHSAQPGKKIKAGLRLDHAAGWLSGGDSGPALVPGEVEKSALIKAVRYTGLEFEAMPPKSQLAREEVALLEEWVKRGAPVPEETPPVIAGDAVGAGVGPKPKQVGLTIEEGKKFWAFVPPANPPVPEPAKFSTTTTATRDWPRTAIDRFIAAEWGSKGLRPAADAGRATLLRRATFDLTGLPPTPEALDAFVRDPRATPDAFASAVDAMLASPHFGERWGRHWLDVARFAESSGGGRTLMFKDAWRYRDYVVDAFNRDLPFDQFIREQLAGDLLAGATPDERRRQITATAFLALGPTNYEEQNKDQLRMDIVDEQLDTMGKAFLGMTIGCARCHDHKFDPVPTRDYYALAGIFRSTHTLHNYTDNVAKWVDAPLPADPADETEIAAHESKVTALEKRIARLRKSAVATAAGQAVALASLPGLVLDDQQAKIVGGWSVSTTVKPFLGAGYLTDNNEEKGRRTVTFTPAIPQSGRYEVRFAYTAQANRATNVPVTILHADGENTVIVNERETPPLDGHFISLGTFRFEKDGAGYVLVSNEGANGFVIVDALQLVATEPRADLLPVVLAGTSDGPKKAAKKTMAEPADPAARKAAAELRTLEAELKKLTAGGPKRAVAMSVREADGEIGDTEIRVRGIARSLGAKAPRGFLQVATHGAPPKFSPTESGRRELADWIASPANPLTARVFANRVWGWLLGAGLVRTVDNFGTTGERPSHPALLDHLARQFVADGWSVKKLVRAIVLSRTYQLAAASAPDATRLDPDNRLFSHANRRRLEAEEIRDAILAVSGQLDLAIGGPNIGAGKGTPGGAPAASEYGYIFSDTRRSLYTPAFRNTRLELFEVFDLADINASIGRRAATTVAPQALFLMNHPFVIEQARHAAERTLREAGPDDAARVERAYRVTLGRAPSPNEFALALRFGSSAAGEIPSVEARAEEWAQLHQSLFACVDFRYLD
ncbi:MAG: hypothetical protein RLZZ15_496 [Verrucomicrobiota bacterium]